MLKVESGKVNRNDVDKGGVVVEIIGVDSVVVDCCVVFCNVIGCCVDAAFVTVDKKDVVVIKVVATELAASDCIVGLVCAVVCAGVVIPRVVGVSAVSASVGCATPATRIKTAGLFRQSNSQIWLLSGPNTHCSAR